MGAFVVGVLLMPRWLYCFSKKFLSYFVSHVSSCFASDRELSQDFLPRPFRMDFMSLGFRSGTLFFAVEVAVEYLLLLLVLMFLDIRGGGDRDVLFLGVVVVGAAVVVRLCLSGSPMCLKLVLFAVLDERLVVVLFVFAFVAVGGW